MRGKMAVTGRRHMVGKGQKAQGPSIKAEIADGQELNH